MESYFIKRIFFLSIKTYTLMAFATHKQVWIFWTTPGDESNLNLFVMNLKSCLQTDTFSLTFPSYLQWTWNTSASAGCLHYPLRQMAFVQPKEIESCSQKALAEGNLLIPAEVPWSSPTLIKHRFHSLSFQ